MSRFEKHIFICINQRYDGRQCCGKTQGEELVFTLKQLVKMHRLQGKIRVNKSGCLDACKLGPAMVIYPEGTWYGKLTKEKVEEIFHQHILGGKPVKGYLLKFGREGTKFHP